MGKFYDPPVSEFKAAMARAESVYHLCEILGISKDTLRKYARRHNIDYSSIRHPGCIHAPKHIERPNDALTNEDIVKLCEERGIAVMKDPIVENQEFESRTPVLDGNGTFRLGIVSDTHLGSKYQQLTFLHTAYDYFERHEIADVIHAGDLCGGADSMHKGMVHDLFLHGADETIEYSAEVYPQRVGVLTHIISGNHDHSHMKANGTNVVKNIAKERPDLHYMGMSGAYLTINGIRIYVHHPSGGVPYARSYRLQKQIEQFSPELKPKILVTGHLHVTAVLESYRNVYGFLAGCFESQSGYMVERGIFPEIGFSVLEVEYDDYGAVSFTKKWVPFYVPIERDYKV